jgi:hypothetical protein
MQLTHRSRHHEDDEQPYRKSLPSHDCEPKQEKPNGRFRSSCGHEGEGLPNGSPIVRVCPGVGVKAALSVSVLRSYLHD